MVCTISENKSKCPMVIGLWLSLLITFIGFGMGGWFGIKEDAIKAHLKASAYSVLDSVYQGDTAKADYVSGRAWVYFKRAHMHAGGIGTSAAVAILALLLLGCKSAVARYSALAMGVGSLFYPLFFLLVGINAPVLGGADPAKAAWSWFAHPSGVLLVLGMLGAVIEIGKKALHKGNC